MTPIGRPITAGVLIGVGVAGFIDETVFHQLLRWHHFYDGTPAAGLISDGLFHAFSWIAVVTGLFLFADVRRREAVYPTLVPLRRLVWGGGLLGWGAFQVYDGLVQHKLLDLHQIRYRVEVLPYDVAWNAAGALGVVAGLVLLRAARSWKPVDGDSARATRGTASAHASADSADSADSAERRP